MIKIGLYSPYLDALGGGERYFFTLAQVLTDLGQVEIIWPDQRILVQARDRLGLNLDQVAVSTAAVGKLTGSLLTRFRLTRNYDRFFWVSDGSLPFLFAARNILHFQVPFRRSLSTLDRLKLGRIDQVVVNSRFTKQVIDRHYQVTSQVVYPPVQTRLFKPARKRNVIAVVGRFAKHFLAKKQEVLIRAFQTLCDQGLSNWRLKLIGGILPTDQDYLNSLQEIAKDYPVEFLVNVPLATVVKVLGEAEILWHAAGFGEDQLRHPERMEHFGIAPVEAQAAGCLPLVYAGGGLVEVVKDGVNGYLWRTEEELVAKTKQLIREGIDPKMQKQAQKDSQRFSQDKFARKMKEVFR